MSTKIAKTYPSSGHMTELVWVYEGDQMVRLREAVEQDVQNFLGAEMADSMAYEKFSIHSKDSAEGMGSVCQRVLESIDTPPIFTSKKVIQLQMDEFSFSGRGSKSKPIEDLLGQVAAKVPPENEWLKIILILGFKSSMTKLGFKKGQFVVKPFFADEESAPLIQRALKKIKDAGKRIQSKDLDEWIRCADDEEMFWKQLDQILLQVGENVEISRLQLEPHLSFEIDSNVFAFANAIGKRDVGKALSLIHQAIEVEGDAPQVVVGRLMTSLQQLMMVSALLRRRPIDFKRYSRDRNGVCQFPDSVIDGLKGIARAGVERKFLDKHPYAVKAVLSNAGLFQERDLDRWLEELAQLDRKLKSSSTDGKYLLENAVIRILGD